MNNTEIQYSRLLETMKNAGEILSWHFEPVKFRLADNTFYTPDFMVVYPGHLEFHEIKGFWRDDARVKFKVVSELYPYFKFTCIKKNKNKFIAEKT